MMIRRLVQLYAGLFVFGISTALMVRSDLGLNPWDVFHEGLGGRTPLSFGAVVIITGAIVLLLWIPLRQRPGLGTISNIIVIGVAADFGLWLIPDVASLPVRAVMLTAGILLNGAATSAYIGAGFGPGPRDGLMTGLAARTGWPIRSVRTGIELTVLATGWALGGTVGIGTILYAVTIGPIVHLMLPFFTKGLCRSEQRKPGGRSPTTR
jgi:uncharacterized membrane protein YczE